MGATIETLKGHTDSLPCVTFHPTNPDIVATGSKDKTAKIWNRTNGRVHHDAERAHRPSAQRCFPPNKPNPIIATGSWDNTNTELEH